MKKRFCAKVHYLFFCSVINLGFVFFIGYDRYKPGAPLSDKENYSISDSKKLTDRALLLNYICSDFLDLPCSFMIKLKYGSIRKMG